MINFNPLPHPNSLPLIQVKLAGGSSMSVEFLLSACRDGGSIKFKKGNSNKCFLANSFFQPTDKIVSSVTHKIYSCMNYVFAKKT